MSEVQVSTVLCPYCGHVSEMADASGEEVFGGVDWTCLKCHRDFYTASSLIGRRPGISVSPENVTHVVYLKSGWVFDVEACQVVANAGRLRFYDTRPLAFEPFSESEEEEAHWIASFQAEGVVAIVAKPHLVKAIRRKVIG